MPYAALKPCSVQACPNAAAHGSTRCTAHARPTYTPTPFYAKPTPRHSTSSSDYDLRWQRLRRWYLRRHPMCTGYPVKGACSAPARDLDHIIPHQGNTGTAFYDTANLQGLCRACHSRKTSHDRSAGLTRTEIKS